MKRILMICLVVVGACAQTKKTDTKALKDQVMEVHDAVMPKMGELRMTEKQLLAVADSLAEDTVAATRYRELAVAVSSANKSMMNWMHGFDPDFAGSEEEVKTYLEGQLKEIEEVKRLMLSSLEEGQKALN
ncbi:hypothetical protein [Marinoscillum sp.]|uniref:hypothetical protein n=1 Tax=Marinoscillum sp. TaxID=2024838 RepID=UPI003BAD264F